MFKLKREVMQKNIIEKEIENARYYQAVNDSLSLIIKKIPKESFIKSRARAYLSVGKTLLLIILSLWAIQSMSMWDSAWKWPLGLLVAWGLLGTVLTGGFDIAHDAAHRSLFENVKENNFWGHIFSSLVGWPFHLWRHAHNIHHKYTNNASRDIAWEPYPDASLAKIPTFFRVAYRLVRSKWYFYWTGGLFHLLEQFIKFGKNKRFSKEDRPGIWWSIAFTAIIFTSYLVLTASWGWYGLIVGFIVPVSRYYYWLTTFTMLHHLHPEKPFVEDKEWHNNIGAIQLLGTINVRYGWYTDFLDTRLFSQIWKQQGTSYGSPLKTNPFLETSTSDTRWNFLLRRF